MTNISTRLKNRDYPATTVEKHLSEVIFPDRKKALEQRNKNVRKKILPFVTQDHPALPNLKNIYTHGKMATYTDPTISQRHL